MAHDYDHPAAAAALAPVEVTGTVAVAGLEPIIDKGVRTSPQAAGYGGWQTYVFAGTEQPIVIIPYDDARARALVIVSGTGPVCVGTVAQVTAYRNQGATVGGILASGATVEVKNQQQLWLAPDGTHPATVTVLNERWET